MQATLEQMIEELKALREKDPEALLTRSISMCTDLYYRRMKDSQSDRINTEVFSQHFEALKKISALEAELKTVKELLKKEIEKNALKTRSTFGRKSEAFLTLVDSAGNPIEEHEDESDIEEADESSDKKTRILAFDSTKNGKKSDENDSNDPKNDGDGKKKTKRGTSLTNALKRFPKNIRYDIDIDKLNQEYGEGNWRIAYWHEHTTLEKIESPYYVQIIYTPVISTGLEHLMFTLPYRNILLDKSHLSTSILSDLLYRKFFLSLPCYRIAMDYQMQGVDLSKQTILGWINRLVPEFLGELQEYLLQLLISKYRYIQMDETYIQVNKDKRGPGHKSFMWVHCSSELVDCPPIIVFTYEVTRGTDHLRNLLGEFLGYITCDAYISYKVYEDERNGEVLTSGCLMHCRRYFAEAFFIQNVSELSEDELAEMPETKALLLLREVFHEESSLKDLTADDRVAARAEKVAPKLDLFFEYVRSLESSKEIYSDRMTKAISYALKQEENLRRFLTDGNIPCDNGHAERVIRSYSVGRANWLFADTVRGAEVYSVMYTIVETAKANHVNVLTYLQYLLEQIPRRKTAGDVDYLADMVPWSEAYREYERNHLSRIQRQFDTMFPTPERPKTPGKPKDQTPEDSPPTGSIGEMPA